MKKIFMTMMVAALTLGFHSCSSSDDDELETIIEQEQTDDSGDEETEEENSDAITYAATITNTELAAVLAEIIDGVTLDDNGYGLVTQEAIDSTTELDISDRGLTSISGIEYFDNLTSLNCSDNPLTDFDISALAGLKVLDCSRCFNQLSVSRSTFYLDLSAQIVLEELYCSENGLTELDLSANVALSVLYCNSNALVSLNLSANISLSILYCQENSLISLDLSVNVNLSVLVCYQNYLSYLDISANTNLSMVICGYQIGTSLSLTMTAEQYESDLFDDDDYYSDILVTVDGITSSGDDDDDSLTLDDFEIGNQWAIITIMNDGDMYSFESAETDFDFTLELNSKNNIYESFTEYIGKNINYSSYNGEEETTTFTIYGSASNDLEFSFTITPSLRQNATPTGVFLVQLYFYSYGECSFIRQWQYTYFAGNHLLYSFIESDSEETVSEFDTEISPITFSTDEIN